jgi:hypothetical protein
MGDVSFQVSVGIPPIQIASATDRYFCCPVVKQCETCATTQYSKKTKMKYAFSAPNWLVAAFIFSVRAFSGINFSERRIPKLRNTKTLAPVHNDNNT